MNNWISDKMRRRAGVGAIQKKTLAQEKYKDKGSELQEGQIVQLSKQMDQFRINLEEFAAKHRSDIKQNGVFRRQFQTMCSSIGVDPLNSAKGFWSVLGIGDFYYELAVQIIEVCLATSEKNGGLIGLNELRTRLVQARGRRKENQEITEDDLRVAAKKLAILGSGFSIVEVSKGQFMVQSVPVELSMDHSAVLQLASSLNQPYVSAELIQKSLNWQQERTTNALTFLCDSGFVWVDKHAGQITYWFPSMFDACIGTN